MIKLTTIVAIECVLGLIFFIAMIWVVFKDEETSMLTKKFK